jgi:hypothetical protein
MITCEKCGIEKAETEFYPSSLKCFPVWCKKCKNDYTNNYLKRQKIELKQLKAENYLLKLQLKEIEKK